MYIVCAVPSTSTVATDKSIVTTVKKTKSDHPKQPG